MPVLANYTYDPFVCFRDYIIPSAGALRKSTTALQEWIGLLWYSLWYA